MSTQPVEQASESKDQPQSKTAECTPKAMDESTGGSSLVQQKDSERARAGSTDSLASDTTITKPASPEVKPSTRVCD